MATMKMPAVGVEGGSKVVYGSNVAQIAANTTTPVNCGFEPKHIILGFQYGTGSGWFQVTCIFDADTSTNTVKQCFDNDARDYSLPIPATGYVGIGAVNSSGFTIANNSYPIKNVYWLATG